MEIVCWKITLYFMLFGYLGVFLQPRSTFPLNQILPFYKSCIFQSTLSFQNMNKISRIKIIYYLKDHASVITLNFECLSYYLQLFCIGRRNEHGYKPFVNLLGKFKVLLWTTFDVFLRLES